MNISDLSLFRGKSALHFQMTVCEQMALQHILDLLKPQRALEIGTYQGGSLQVLSHYCSHVESIDIDPSIPAALGPQFTNVTFHTGNSFELLPSILSQSTESRNPFEFILIDGDHSSEGVKRDINAILSVLPTSELFVLMHDAFNPQCRAGILSANWQLSPHVHELEIDFIPGVYHHESYDTAAARTMWGGFACALLKPEPRQGALVISQRQQGLYEAVFRQSSHAPQQPTMLQRSKARLRSFAKAITR
jgi:hypothetical protein